MNETLKSKQKKRIAFLNKLYDLSEGSTSKIINCGEIASAIGLSNGDEMLLADIAKYLKNEGLIKINSWSHAMPVVAQLTHCGLKEIEEAIGSPDKQTKHFMPVNLLFVENMIGSNVQQGSVSSSQVLHIQNEAKPALKEFLNQLKSELPKLGLDVVNSQDLKAEIDTVEAQLASSKPKVPILKTCLLSIKGVLETITGSAIGGHLATRIPKLLSLLDQS